MNARPFHQAATALTAPALPWLLALALALGPVWRPALDPVGVAQAQSRIDELKGAKGKGVRSDDIPTGESGWAFRLGSDERGARVAAHSPDSRSRA